MDPKYHLDVQRHFSWTILLEFTIRSSFQSPVISPICITSLLHRTRSCLRLITFGGHPVLTFQCCTPTDDYIFTWTPTFTQGLVLGQISILPTYFILEYPFFDPKSRNILRNVPKKTHPSSGQAPPLKSLILLPSSGEGQGKDGERDEDFAESAGWLNVLLKQVTSRMLREGAIEYPDQDESWSTCSLSILAPRRGLSVVLSSRCADKVIMKLVR